MTELMVDEYGFVVGGEEAFPVDVIEHDWETRYPPFEDIPAFQWEPGVLESEPDIFRHPEIRDWICNERAWSALRDIAEADFNLIGEGRLKSKRMYVVQVTTMLDVVDRASSLIKDYGSYQVVEFPTLYRRAEREFQSRAFRVPGSYTDLFIGAIVKERLDAAGILGLRYTPVPLSPA